MRFFMNMRYRGRLIPDYEGDELADAQALRGHALATARDLVFRTRMDTIRSWFDCSFEVTDEWQSRAGDAVRRGGSRGDVGISLGLPGATAPMAGHTIRCRGSVASHGRQAEQAFHLAAAELSGIIRSLEGCKNPRLKSLIRFREASMSYAFHPLTVEKAAEAYVLSRGKAGFLSISQAIRAIRTLMPGCKATDHELEELLAEACIMRGVPVAFDIAIVGSSETRLHS